MILTQKIINEFLDPKVVEFKEVDRTSVKDFVEKHYLGAYPASAKFYVGIFYNGVMVGMVIYGSPFGPQVVRAIFKPEAGMEHKNILELKRLFLVDDETILSKEAKKNLAGYSIINANSLVSQKFPDVKAIVTFSDSLHHTGAVYKATNAIYQGEYNSKKRWVYPIGDKSQKLWVLNQLKTNIDWKNDINEALGKGQSDFSKLPNDRPYGFVIFPNGSFSVVEDFGGHDFVARKSGYSDVNDLIDSGGLRVAWDRINECYSATGNEHIMTFSTKKTAKDLSSFYSVDLRFYSSISYREIRESVKEGLDILTMMWNDIGVI